MKTLVNSIFRFTLSLLLLTGYSHAKAANANSRANAANANKANSRTTATTHLVSTKTFSLERTKSIRTALSIYQEMNLGAAGLNEEAFEYAYVGYERLRKRRLLHKKTVLS